MKFKNWLLLIAAFLLAILAGQLFGQNKPPQAIDNRIEMGEGAVMTYNVLSNDSDPDGDYIRLSSFTFMGKSYTIALDKYKIISLWDTGKLSVHSNGTVVFWPQKEFNGANTDGSIELPPIVYTINDGHGGTAKATVIIAYFDSFYVIKDSVRYCFYDQGLNRYCPLYRVRVLGKVQCYYDMGLKYWIRITRKEYLFWVEQKIICK